MIFCKDCNPNHADCDFCLYAAHEYWKMDNGEIICGGPISCMLHTDIVEEDLMVCDDFHCFREPWIGGKIDG